MSEAAKDTRRAIAALTEIIDGRNIDIDGSSILVTAEHAIAALLMMLMRDPRKAAWMLNERVLQGVEERLAFYAAKERETK